MFDKVKGMWEQFQLMQKAMKDENFKAFVSHPKVQEIFKEAEFKKIAGKRDFGQILAHPKFAALLHDPEVASLMAKVDFRALLNH